MQVKYIALSAGLPSGLKNIGKIYSPSGKFAEQAKNRPAFGKVRLISKYMAGYFLTQRV